MILKPGAKAPLRVCFLIAGEQITQGKTISTSR